MTAHVSRAPSVSEELAAWLVTLDADQLSVGVRAAASRVFLDVAGLSVSARQTDYMAAMLASLSRGGGECTVLGQTGRFSLFDAALANGTAAHGEDFDDTFEGAPLHVGASAVPAVLAICEAEGRRGRDLLVGIVAAAETMARLALAAPGAIHRSGFQPASVLGCMGAAVGASVAIGATRAQIVDALGLAGSFASGLMEFLAEGAWSKRMQPGWAAQAGLRAAKLARCGFNGPRTVLEGRNGFFRAFASSVTPDLASITEGLGTTWRMERIAFKLYPCGTMIQPYIDCAMELHRRGIAPEQIARIVCRVAQPVVERQWEPLGDKQSPASAFAARFSGPIGVALGLIDGAAGLENYSDENLANPRIREMARKVFYEVDPDSDYPENYSGHLVVHLQDGTLQSAHQPHLRGGWRQPASQQELTQKFMQNTAFGGWPGGLAQELMRFCEEAFGFPDLRALRQFRR